MKYIATNKRNNKKLLTGAALTGFLVCLLFISIPQIHAEDKEQSKREKKIESLREDLIDLYKEIKKDSKNAYSVYDELKEQAKNLKQTADHKLDKLSKEIKKAENSRNFNKDELEKAKSLKEKAQNLYTQKKYRKVPPVVDSALQHIITVPIITLNVEPGIFSPNNDGKKDEVTIKAKVKTKRSIDRWTLKIYRDGPESNSVIKKWQGKGMPSEEFTWNGLVDGERVVDSAETYSAVMTAVDSEDGKGKSNNTSFKSDIFTTETDRGPVINVSSIKFEYDNARLKKEYKDIVEKVYDYLLQFSEYKIIVEGHTDSLGDSKENIDLAKRRAHSVRDYLVELGMKPSRLKVYSIGEVMPVTLDSWKITVNRRVSFILIKDRETMKEYKKFYNDLDRTKEIVMKNPEALKKVVPELRK